MAQRISRAKKQIKTSGASFAMPTGGEWGARARSVLHVLYLIRIGVRPAEPLRPDRDPEQDLEHDCR